MPDPILVTGSHRSGTTWVGRTLAVARGVGYISEPFSINRRPGICNAPFVHWYTYVTGENEAGFRASLERTLAFRYGYMTELVALPASWRGARQRNAQPSPPSGPGEFGDDVIPPPLPMPHPGRHLIKDGANFLRHRLTRSRPLMKDPMALFSAEWLAATFGATPVVLIRHPAAFASSLQRVDWRFPFSHFLEQPLLMRDHLEPFRPELEEFVAREHDILDQAMLLWRVIYQIVDTFRQMYPEWIFIRHEDLSREPLAGFRELFAALGLEFNARVEEFVRSRTMTSSARDPAPDEVELLVRDSRWNADAWKRRFTSEEVAHLRSQVGTLASRFYADDEW